MTQTATALASPCRQVTAQEVAHYLEHGWVKLERFIEPEVIATLLGMAKRRMGEDGDSNEAYGLNQPYFNAEAAEGLGNRQVRALIEGIGRNAAVLQNRPEVKARYFSDFFAPKLPCSKVTRNAGNGATAFHQDFITFAVDRTGGMTFWIPLEAYGPDAGTMSFIEGSHKLGVMGSYHTYGDGDARDAFPALKALPMSEPVTYALGDITVHSHLTIHGAGQNQTDHPRWAYIVLTQPEDVCWNGAPPEAFDTTGMVPNQRLDDERFPLLG